MAEAARPVRTWQVIATELSKERNAERVLALAEELGLALVSEQQSPKKDDIPSPSRTRHSTPHKTQKWAVVIRAAASS